MAVSKAALAAIVAVIIVVVVGVGVWYWLTMAAPTPTPTKPAYKMAIILPGPINDGAWNTLGYLTCGEATRKYNIETAYSQYVAAADAERVAREYIADGYNIIIFHGGEYVAPASKLVDEFPDVIFVIHAGEPIDKPNVWTVVRDDHRYFYFTGYLMAKLSKSGKIAFLDSQEFPCFVAGVNLMYLAAKEVNPDIKVYYVYVGDWNDPVKAREATEALIAQGVDVIYAMVNLGFFGVVEAVKEASHHVWIIDNTIAKPHVDPEHYATATEYKVTDLYVNIIGQIIKGKKNGSISIVDYTHLSEEGSCPKDILKDAHEIEEKVKKGEIELPQVPFDKYIVPPP